ncbi:MAG: hypothetical protein V4490_06885, partial [Pseudomonadota bacterium]
MDRTGRGFLPITTEIQLQFIDAVDALGGLYNDFSDELGWRERPRVRGSLFLANNPNEQEKERVRTAAAENVRLVDHLINAYGLEIIPDDNIGIVLSLIDALSDQPFTWLKPLRERVVHPEFNYALTQVKRARLNVGNANMLDSVDPNAASRGYNQAVGLIDQLIQKYGPELFPQDQRTTLLAVTADFQGNNYDWLNTFREEAAQEAALAAASAPLARLASPPAVEATLQPEGVPIPVVAPVGVVEIQRSAPVITYAPITSVEVAQEKEAYAVLQQMKFEISMHGDVGSAPRLSDDAFKTIRGLYLKHGPNVVPSHHRPLLDEEKLARPRLLKWNFDWPTSQAAVEGPSATHVADSTVTESASGKIPSIQSSRSRSPADTNPKVVTPHLSTQLFPAAENPPKAKTPPVVSAELAAAEAAVVAAKAAVA